MSLVLKPAHEHLLTGSRATFLTTCWRMARNDTKVFRYTEHDEKLVVDREEYTAFGGGFDASAVHRQSNLRDQNLEAEGFLGTDISASDLRNGLFDGARVTELRVDWRFPWLGPLFKSNYWIDSVHWAGTAWAVEMVGISRWLRRRSGVVLDPNCRHTLGDAG